MFLVFLFFEALYFRSILAASEPKGASPASAIFLDVTQQSGIDFVHFNRTTGEYLLPEITGAGALFDYDNDGGLLSHLKRDLARYENGAPARPPV